MKVIQHANAFLKFEHKQLIEDNCSQHAQWPSVAYLIRSEPDVNTKFAGGISYHNNTCWNYSPWLSNQHLTSNHNFHELDFYWAGHISLVQSFYETHQLKGPSIRNVLDVTRNKANQLWRSFHPKQLEGGDQALTVFQMQLQPWMLLGIKLWLMDPKLCYKRDQIEEKWNEKCG